MKQFTIKSRFFLFSVCLALGCDKTDIESPNKNLPPSTETVGLAPVKSPDVFSKITNDFLAPGLGILGVSTIGVLALQNWDLKRNLKEHIKKSPIFNEAIQKGKCNLIQNFFKDNPIKTIGLNNFVAQFEHIKDLRGGIGGAQLYIVKSKDAVENAQRVIKIFPAHKGVTDLKNNHDFREIYFTCLNSAIFSTYNIIPTYYTAGNIGTQTPFAINPPATGVYPYMVMELIPGGFDLVKVALEPGNAKRDLGLNFAIPDLTKETAEEIKNRIKEIVEMLIRVTRAMGMLYQAHSFEHNDLHPKNIMLVKKKVSDKSDTFQIWPKIIDFGLSTSLEYPKPDIPIYRKNRPFNQVNKDFYKYVRLNPDLREKVAANLNAKPNPLPKTAGFTDAEKALYKQELRRINQKWAKDAAYVLTHPQGSDLNSFNLILAALRPVLDATIRCTSWLECTNKLTPLKNRP